MRNLERAIATGLAATWMLGVFSTAAADDSKVVVPVNLVDANGIGHEAGTVTITESAHGLVFSPALQGLPPGVHGFHVHENPDCAPGVKDGKPGAALKAGAHYDPAKSGHHSTPWGDGHLGDRGVLALRGVGAADDGHRGGGGEGQRRDGRGDEREQSL